MTVETLRNRFVDVKQCEPENHDQLLDFARRKYLKGELSLSEYKKVMYALEQDGATNLTFP
ncbi:hypothetical protein HPB58_20225 [Priestia filamentosa]|jgi:hypothetical protein|uniref:YppF-like protein n=2 Tax=Priestia endophytica TaxID=135735 RepID=A0AAX1Q218_9BACI|nr:MULTISPECIES: YppF family protein [Priestia]KAB2496135.1 hypothetical protein F8155_00775 [Priestia endophytica]KYG31482.1 hypothetical protein AZF06_07010 [Priestia endophytica]MBG9811647.1 hypothetical protein [Priestia endophytica]MCM3536924.1 YppF family protein [Priestia endophytica]MCY8230883.1 YppF family protein [Priestia endophytica]